MAITSTDIKVRLSSSTGPGNSTAGTPATSLGEFMSSTDVNQSTTLNNLFDDVTGVENEAEDVEYRCIFVYNSHGSLTYQGALVYVYSQVSGGTEVAIAIDSTAASAYNSASDQALEIVDESDSTSVLSGLSFSTPTSSGTALSLGDIASGYCRAIWVRRTAQNNAAVSNDGCVLRIIGGTAA